MLISVIVPVYNVELYLRRCVESIRSQTYRKIEILLVDDGSTDGSGQICDELALKDSRIHVFHKENGGVSSARNLGIEKSCGEYICFVDSDDWLEYDYFEKAAPVLEKEHPTLLMNNYVKDDGNGHAFCEFASSPMLYLEREEAFYEMAKRVHFGWEPVASFYEALSCKKIKFDSEIVFGEDLLFRYQFAQTNKGLYIYQYLPKYHYFIRMDSAVNSYAIYKKVDDLKVLERVMIEANYRIKHLLLYKEYVPRLIHYYMLGIQSSNYRDIVAVKEIRRKIKWNIRLFLKDDAIGIFMRLKLIVCLFPQSIGKKLWRISQVWKKYL